MRSIEEIREYGNKLVCKMVLEKFTGRPFKRFDAKKRNILSLVLLFFLFEIVELIALFLNQQPIRPVFIGSLLAALIASLSIYVVNWCMDYAFEQIGSVTLSGDVEKRLADWWKTALNLTAQLLTSIVFTTIFLIALYFIDKRIGTPFSCNTATFISLGILIFWLMQGGYWAFLSPFVTNRLRESDPKEIRIYPMYPSESPVLRRVSRVLSVFAIWDTIIITLCLIGLFVLPGEIHTGRFLYPLLFVLLGYMVSGWTFLYPQWTLTQIVQDQKENTLSHIGSEINKMYRRLGKLEKEDFERLNGLMSLYDSVRESPNTVISFSALRSFIGSLATPTIVAVVGILLR